VKNSPYLIIYFQSVILEFLNVNGGPRKIDVAKKVKNGKKEIETNERHDERPALINFVARLGSSVLVIADGDLSFSRAIADLIPSRITCTV
jgi:precorrin-6B methylase 1